MIGAEIADIPGSRSPCDTANPCLRMRASSLNTSARARFVVRTTCVSTGASSASGMNAMSVFDPEPASSGICIPGCMTLRSWRGSRRRGVDAHAVAADDGMNGDRFLGLVGQVAP